MLFVRIVRVCLYGGRFLGVVRNFRVFFCIVFFMFYRLKEVISLSLGLGWEGFLRVWI